jgi:hypothetical protein
MSFIIRAYDSFLSFLFDDQKEYIEEYNRQIEQLGLVSINNKIV